MNNNSQTASTLAKYLVGLGLEQGMTVMVHASFGKVGWTEGGAATVIKALLDVIGPDGTLVMPAASPELAPSEGELKHPPNPSRMFNRLTTPTSMGAIAECFRTWPGTLRSNHPLDSVCANGPKAHEIVKEHSRVFCEGNGTPFEKLYELDGYTLLLGVGFNRCTSLHYAEFLSSRRRVGSSHLAIIENGKPRWLKVEDMAADNSTHFPIVGDRFVSTGKVQTGKIGHADSYLFSTRELVDFATPYFDDHLEPTS